MGEAVQPAVADLDGEKGAIRAQYAVDFRKRFFLLLLGVQMMQNENGNDGRKGLIGKWQ